MTFYSYEGATSDQVVLYDDIAIEEAPAIVITSYSIHYTKLYDIFMMLDIKQLIDIKH